MNLRYRKEFVSISQVWNRSPQKELRVPAMLRFVSVVLDPKPTARKRSFLKQSELVSYNRGPRPASHRHHV